MSAHRLTITLLDGSKWACEAIKCTVCGGEAEIIGKDLIRSEPAVLLRCDNCNMTKSHLVDEIAEKITKAVAS